jgi:hypothetical protein
MIEHQHIISSHHKEMQALRDSLSLAMERFESISKRNENDLSDFKTAVLSHISLIKEKMTIDHNSSISQKNMIEDLFHQVLDFHVTYPKKNDMESFKKEVTAQIKESTLSNINSFQDCQRDLKILVQLLRDDLVRIRFEMEQKISRLSEKIDSDFSIFHIDREGIVNEVRTYEKNIFIIEKKIENIYTLIERINKRGEICHKPE